MKSTRKVKSSPTSAFGSLDPKGRLLVRVVGIGPVLFFAAAAGVRLFHAGQTTYQHLTPIVAAVASEQLHREVRLGHVRISHLGDIDLDGLAVSNSSTFAASHGEPLLAAPHVRITYSLHSLLFDPTNALHALTRIEVDRPWVVVERRSDKSFNFTDLIAPKKGPNRKPFAGVLVVSNGTLLFRDFMAPAVPHSGPAENTLRSAAARVDCRSLETVLFTVAGANTNGRFTHARLQGQASRVRAGTFQLAIQASDASAPYWAVYLKHIPQIQVQDGTADLSLFLAHQGRITPANAAVDIVANGTIHHGTIQPVRNPVLKLPITDINGPFSATTTGASFSGSAASGAQPFRLAATLLNFANPQVAATVRVDSGSATRILRVFPSLHVPAGVTAGPLSATADIIGPVKAPVVTVVGTAPWIAFQGNVARAVQARLVVANKSVSIPQLNFQDGRAGRASMQLSTTTDAPLNNLAMSGRIQNLDVATVPVPLSLARLHIGGMLTAAFVSTGTGVKRKLVANFHWEHAHLAKTSLHQVRGRLSYAAGTIGIDRLLVQDDKGAAAATGHLRLAHSGPQLDLRLKAAGMDVGALANPYSSHPVAGIGYFDGTIVGAANSPVLQGHAGLFNAAYGRWSVDAISGDIRGSRNAIHLHQLQVRRFPALATVDGDITDIAGGNPAFQLTASLGRAELQDLLLLGSAPAGPRQHALTSSLPNLSGAVTGAVNVSGTLHKPSAVGHLAVTAGTLGPFRIRRFSTNVSLHGTHLVVDNAVLRGEGVTLTARGTMDTARGTVHGIFTGTDLNLARLDRWTLPYVDPEGLVDFSGALDGTLRSPAVSLGFVGRDVALNGQRFAPITAFAQYRDGILALTGDPWDFTILQPPGTPPGTNSVTYLVKALSVDFGAGRSGPAKPSVYASLSIPDSAPEHFGHVAETLRSSYAAKLPGVQHLLASVDALSPVAGTVALPALSIHGPLSDPDVDGSLHLSQVHVGDLSLADAVVAVSSHVQTHRNTHVTGHVAQIDAVSVPLDNLDFDAAQSGDTVELRRLHAASASAYLDASGTAVMGGAIDGSVDASNIPLSLFHRLFPKRRSLEGNVSSFALEASGATKNPTLTASLDVDTPTVVFTSPAVTVRSNTGVLQTVTPEQQTRYPFDSFHTGTVSYGPIAGTAGHIVSINSAALYKAGKAVVTLSGTVPMPDTLAQLEAMGLPNADQLHARLQVQDLGVLAAFSPIFDAARTKGTLAATVEPPDGAGAGLSGRITLSNATIGLQGIGTTLTGTEGLASFNKSGVILDQLRIGSEAGGSITAHGRIGFGPDAPANVQIAFNGFNINESSSKTFLAKAFNSGFRGKLDGQLGVIGPLLRPKITTPSGSPLVVTNVSATIPSASPATSSGGTAPALNPSFDVHVRIAGNGKTAHVSNALLRADTDGVVVVQGELSAPVVKAHLNVYKGQFLLPPTTVLKFVRPFGSVDLNYPVPSSDPSTDGQPVLSKQVDLYAQANVSVRPSTLAANQSATANGQIGSAHVPTFTTASSDAPMRYKINVHIYGLMDVPDRLQMKLDSEPGGLSDQQMLAALGQQGIYSGILAGNLESAVKGQVAEAFNSILLPSFLQPIETGVESALGLSAFTLDYSANQPLHMTLRKELTPRIEVTYARTLGPQTPSGIAGTLQPSYSLSVGYNITKRLQITGSTDEQRNNTISLNGVFGF